MPDSEDQPHRPAIFAAALDAIRHANPRSELVVTEISAPGNLAPYSVALSADVSPVRHGSDSDFGTGRFILLYDPDEPESWGGPFRVVCFAQAPLETDIGIDPFLAEVAWAWLVDALDSRGAEYTAASGTATKILSSGFGELAHQGDGAQIELRASWSPLEGDLAAHVEGWGELLCMLAGLPPAGEGPARPRRTHPAGNEGPGQVSSPHGGTAPGAETPRHSADGEQAGHADTAHNTSIQDYSAHGYSATAAGISLGSVSPIGPMPSTMRRTSPGLHTLGVAASGIEPGGKETVGIDSIGLKTLGTVGAGRETVGMNAVAPNTVGLKTVGITSVEGLSIEGNTALNPGIEPDLAAASEGGHTAGTARAPGLDAPAAPSVGVTDIFVHRASRA